MRAMYFIPLPSTSLPRTRQPAGPLQRERDLRERPAVVPYERDQYLAGAGVQPQVGVVPGGEEDWELPGRVLVELGEHVERRPARPHEHLPLPLGRASTPGSVHLDHSRQVEVPSNPEDPRYAPERREDLGALGGVALPECLW